MNLLLDNKTNGLPQLNNPVMYQDEMIDCEVVSKDMIDQKCLTAEEDERIIIYTSTLFNIATDFGIALSCVYAWQILGARTIAINEGFDTDTYCDEIRKLMPVLESFKLSHNRYKKIRRDKGSDNEEEKHSRNDRITYQSFPDFEIQYNCFKRGEIKKNQWAAEYSISRPTLNRMILDYEEYNNISDSITEPQVGYRISDFPDFKDYYDLNTDKIISKELWANHIKVSRPTLLKLINKYEEIMFVLTEIKGEEKTAVSTEQVISIEKHMDELPKNDRERLQRYIEEMHKPISEGSKEERESFKSLYEWIEQTTRSWKDNILLLSSKEHEKLHDDRK